MVYGLHGSLCSLNFYMECKIFENSSRYGLEQDINEFIKYKVDVSISITSSVVGYSTYYTAIVYYRVR